MLFPPKDLDGRDWFGNNDTVYLIGKFHDKSPETVFKAEVISTKPDNFESEAKGAYLIAYVLFIAATLIAMSMFFGKMMLTRAVEEKEEDGWKKNVPNDLLDLLKKFSLSIIITIPVSIYSVILGRTFDYWVAAGTNMLLLAVFAGTYSYLKNKSINCYYRQKQYFSRPKDALVPHIRKKLIEGNMLKPESIERERLESKIYLTNLNAVVSFRSSLMDRNDTIVKVGPITRDNSYEINDRLIPFLDNKLSKVHWYNGKLHDNERFEKNMDMLEKYMRDMVSGGLTEREKKRREEEIDRIMEEEFSSYK